MSKLRYMEFKAKEIAEILKGTVEGDPEARISTFARIESGKPGAICFFANPKYEHYVYDCAASVILVNDDFVPQRPVKATLIRVPNAYASVAALLDYVTAAKRSYRRYRGCHIKRFLSTKIGKKVYVGSGCYLGRNASIGDYSKIYEQVYVGDGVKIGKKCIIYPGVKIYPGMEIGDNVIIEDDVEIGANTTVDKSQMGSTVIRKGAKIDNLCQIAHNVEVGEHTVMAAQTGIAGSTKIGSHCVIGGQVGIAGHLTIADHTTLAAQTGVISSIKSEGQVFLGSPALPHKQFLRAYAVFRRNGKE